MCCLSSLLSFKLWHTEAPESLTHRRVALVSSFKCLRCKFEISLMSKIRTRKLRLNPPEVWQLTSTQLLSHFKLVDFCLQAVCVFTAYRMTLGLCITWLVTEERGPVFARFVLKVQIKIQRELISQFRLCVTTKSPALGLNMGSGKCQHLEESLSLTSVNKKQLKQWPEETVDESRVSRCTHGCCTPELCWCSCRSASSRRRPASPARRRPAPPRGRCGPPGRREGAGLVSVVTRCVWGCWTPTARPSRWPTSPPAYHQTCRCHPGGERRVCERHFNVEDPGGENMMSQIIYKCVLSENYGGLRLTKP